MGEHLRLREANERANASLQAVKEMIPGVQNNTMMLNALTKMVYDMATRLSAMEIVLARSLEQAGGKTFGTLLDEFIAEQQAQDEHASDDGTHTEGPALQTTDS